MPPIELYQFRFSHFNEKARWALDLKRVPHTRRSLLPGPHGPVVKRMTGRTELPVLVDGGEVISGSAAILDHLERRHPGPSLYPEDPAQRREALEIQKWFDDEVGPEGRRALFIELLTDASYAARCFTQGFGAPTRFFYGLTFPLARILMRRVMQLHPQHHEPALAVVRRALDFVAEKAGPQGFLVGDRFSVADLTAASLLLLVAFPPELEFGLSEPRARVVQSWLARWADHPGTRWVERMYREHRPPAFTG